MSLLTAGQLRGQSLEHYVIGSAGFAIQNAGLQLSFTVGEPLVGVHQTTGLQLHQGFQQAVLATITGVAVSGDVRVIAAYPNPLDASLFLEATTPDAHELSWEIFDLNGRYVFDTRPFKGNGSTRQEIDVGHLAPGIYFLVFRTREGHPVKTIKLQKIP